MRQLINALNEHITGLEQHIISRSHEATLTNVLTEIHASLSDNLMQMQEASELFDLLVKRRFIPDRATDDRLVYSILEKILTQFPPDKDKIEQALEAVAIWKTYSVFKSRQSVIAHVLLSYTRDKPNHPSPEKIARCFYSAQVYYPSTHELHVVLRQFLPSTDLAVLKKAFEAELKTAFIAAARTGNGFEAMSILQYFSDNRAQKNLLDLCFKELRDSQQVSPLMPLFAVLNAMLLVIAARSRLIDRMRSQKVGELTQCKNAAIAAHTFFNGTEEINAIRRFLIIAGEPLATGRLYRLFGTEEKNGYTALTKLFYETCFNPDQLPNQQREKFIYLGKILGFSKYEDVCEFFTRDEMQQCIQTIGGTVSSLQPC